MLPPNAATAHTDRETFRKRARQAHKRGDKYMGKIEDIRVKFHPKFDQFAAAVAYAIRHKVVYRSDGGKFARGLVRASGDLQKIHAEYVNASTVAGATIRLKAKFWRRKDEKTLNRWVMSIRFSAPDWYGEEKGDEIIADEEVSKSAKARNLDNFIDRGLILCNDIPGKTGQRIKKFLEFADKLKYPHNINLWYYTEYAALHYVNWRTDDKTRRRMTKDTGGKMPFDGHTGSGYTGMWRAYPLQIPAKNYSADWPDSRVITVLKAINYNATKAYAEIEKLLDAAAAGAGSVGKSPLAEAFVKHLNELPKNKKHLYYVYKP